MTLACLAPDPDMGVALRLAATLDCQSRALGENGFQALVGSPGMTALLAGLVTIFVALIGYRMILGHMPRISDGIAWAVRLGVVLALVTSWPAFETLIYRVATDGPEELAGVLLPATGLSADGLNDRIQAAYDSIRTGFSGPGGPTSTLAGADASSQPASPSAPGAGLNPAPPPPASMPGLIPALPQTASLFVMATSGMAGALHMASGFLIAVGPLAILGLLFPATTGLFEGWLRILVGTALGGLATSIVTAIELLVVESEITHEQAVQVAADSVSSLDPQALVTIILCFLLVTLGGVYAALRMASALRLPMAAPLAPGLPAGEGFMSRQRVSDTPRVAAVSDRAASAGYQERARAAAVADALSAAVHRDQATAADSGQGHSRTMIIRQHEGQVMAQTVPLGVAGRRASVRRTQSAMRRDRPA
jgi:type IV secretion system protein VirB6